MEGTDVRYKHSSSKTQFLLFFLLIFLLFSVGPLLSPYNSVEIALTNRLQTPSLEHPFGTDQLGRDILVRILEGGKYTVGGSLIAIVLVLMIGVPIGMLSGYFGGRLDAIFMRFADSILAFPEFILAVVFAGLLGPSLFNVLIAIILVKWVTYARFVRGLVMMERKKEYIIAAKISGATHFKIMTQHLLPSVIPSVIVLATLDIGKIILFVSSLSYLGLGAQPPLPEWGLMLNEGKMFFLSHPHLMIFPGLAITITCLIFNILGERLRDQLDVMQEKE